MAPWLDRVYREVDAHAGRSDHADEPARRALLSGVFASAALLAAGLVIMFLQREPRPDHPPSIAQMLIGITRLRGVCLVYAGLIFLAATPVLRVAVMIGVYLRHRQWFMVAVSAVVLGLLAVGLLMGAG